MHPSYENNRARLAGKTKHMWETDKSKNMSAHIKLWMRLVIPAECTTRMIDAPKVWKKSGKTSLLLIMLSTCSVCMWPIIIIKKNDFFRTRASIISRSQGKSRWEKNSFVQKDEQQEWKAN